MSKPIVNINFYGHDKPEFSGLPADFAPLGSLSKGAWQMYRRGSPFFLEGLNVVGRDRLQAKYGRGERGVGDVSLKIPVGEKDVCIYDYNAARTRDSNSRLALDLLDSRISVDLKSSGGLNQDTIFLITGSSAGCISALYLGRLLCERQLKIFYIGLGDPEFYEGESDVMRTSHRIQGEGRYYFKNYYQTKDNPNPWPTDPAVRRTIGFHDEVFGFQSILLDPVLLPGWGRYHFKACQIANDRMFEDVVWCIENC